MAAAARVAGLLLLSVSCAKAAVSNGVAGQNISEIDARLDADLKRHAPQVVVLFAGMNDAANRRAFPGVEETKAHVDSMVRKARASRAEVVLVTLHDLD